jgi:DNA-directed RNA polymerase II subunit RPB2
MPYGENAMVAIACFSGYNQDDSILLNKSSVERGMFHISYYHSYDVKEEIIDTAMQTHTTIVNLVENPKYRESVVLRNKDANYDLLDGDGVITVGAPVTENTILVGIVTPVINAYGQVERYRDVSYLPKKGQHGIVDAVHRYKTADGLQGVKIRVSETRTPLLGDKLGSRHGQKGTCGELIPEYDMPFTKDGLRPDVIVNPHAFPSRMTIGQFIESMSSKAGLLLGSLVDATAFSTKNRVQTVQESLVQLGYHPYGHEIMYNGMTGEIIETEIFMGPTYYMRLKQMTEDKINYRTTGPRTMLTKQPVEGRANGGGLRIGEMERDSLISHGISNFIQESVMKRSDGYEFLFQNETGLLDANIDLPVSTVEMPYSMGLFVHELESTHMSVKLIGE